MAILTYQPGVAAAGNPTNVYQVPELLLEANAVEVIGKLGVKRIRMPANRNETISLLRAVTPEPLVTEVAEGITPATRALTFEQATKTVEEFVEAFQHSSRQAELGEIDILMASKGRLKDLYKRTKEKNAWYEYRACNNALYPSNAITARTGVNAPPSLGRLRTISRLLKSNRAEYVTEMSKGSVFQNTVPIEPAYVILTHTDCISDYRDLPRFIERPRMGGAKEEPFMKHVIGQVEDFIVVASPEFDPYLTSGAAVGSTGMKATGASIDVYTSLCYGREAFGMCEVFGVGELGEGGMSMYVHNKADKSDIANQRRFVACRWLDAPIILNQNWCVAYEHAVTANPV